MRFVTSLAAAVFGVGTAMAAPCPSTDLAALRATVEQACPCAEASSKGAYVKCVKAKLKADGVKGSCKKGMTAAAAQSVCGRSGFVVCCQPGKKGKVVKTAKCKKGTVCQAVPNPDFGVFPLSGSDCSAQGSCPTSSTTSTSTTTTSTIVEQTSSSTTCVTPSSTTSTTALNLCVGGFTNGMVETGEECDDNNPDPTDGCTTECTTCGNGTITAPETCDDQDLESGDGCDANCRPTGCGNGLKVGAETCDDGNTSDNDSCPSDCKVDECTPQSGTDRTVTVNFTGANVAGLTILLDFPEGKVSIPDNIVPGTPDPDILTDYPSGAFPGPNDYGHALLNVVFVSDGSAMSEGRLFNIHFETCGGAPAPVSGDFNCTVLQAADPSGTPIDACGVTCSAVVTP
jgi:cysteine-rich repeat protein